MDHWTNEQLAAMEEGGNARLGAFFQQHHVDSASMSIEDKYKTEAAELYRRQLAARKSKAPVPESLTPEERHKYLDSVRSKIPPAPPTWTRGLRRLSRWYCSCAGFLRSFDASMHVSCSGSYYCDSLTDEGEPRCERCYSRFVLCFRWRHHCRRCGRCVCADCAPSNNTHPILEWGLRQVWR